MNNETQEKKNTSKQILLSVLGVAILIVAVVGISFAAFTYSKAGETTNTITTGTVTMAFTEAENGIKIENAIPMTADQGIALTGTGNTFDFTVAATITGTTNIDYEVVAVKDPTSTVLDKDIRLYLESSTDNSTYTQAFAPAPFVGSAAVSTVGAPAGTMQLAQGTFTNDGATTTQTVYYRLRMWVDSAYVVDGTKRTYKVTVNVYGKGRD